MCNRLETMILKWEYFPEPVGGTTDDPIASWIYVVDLSEANRRKQRFIQDLGNRLISVDVVTRIFPDK